MSLTTTTLSRWADLIRSGGMSDPPPDVAARPTLPAPFHPEPATREHIVAQLVTPQTSFFSGGPLAEALDGELLHRLLSQHRPSRRIRVWSAACASGQEAYSVAMLLHDALPRGWEAEILATDISKTMVKRTFQGNYSTQEVHQGLSDDHRERYFEQFDDRWLISDSVRRLVTAAQLDLTHPLPGLPPFDIVLLRNVLVYFDPAVRSRLLSDIRQFTRRGGYLILDPSEVTAGLDGHWSVEEVAGHPVIQHSIDPACDRVAG